MTSSPHETSSKFKILNHIQKLPLYTVKSHLCDENLIRLKITHLEKVLSIVDKLDSDVRNTIIKQLLELINISTPHIPLSLLSKLEEGTNETIKKYDWAECIAEALKTKSTQSN